MNKLFVFILCLSSIIFSQKAEFDKKLNKLLSGSYFDAAIAGVSIIDLDADTVITEINNKKLLHPASNMKVISSAAGLYYLGSDYQFKTELYTKGAFEGDSFTGDVILKGGLNPDFTTKDLQIFADWFINRGIKNLSGNLLVDVSNSDSLSWGKGWMWDDNPGKDFPYMNSLCINKNSVKVFYKPGKAGEKVVLEIHPNSGYYEVVNKSVTVAEDTSDLTITRDWLNDKNTLIVEGFYSASEKPDSIGINIFNPDFYALHLLRELLTKNGIECNTEFKVFTDSLKSEPDTTHITTLSDILPNLNKESDNLSAEMVLRALGKHHSSAKPFADSGLVKLDKFVEQVGRNPEDYRMVDGSGVSHYNLVTTDLMVQILSHLYKNNPALAEELRLSFPVSGIDGTLKKRMLSGPAHGRIYAKTGTLSGVSTLSGYATTSKGNKIAFSVFIQNFVKKTSLARFYQDKICEMICKYL